MDQEPETPKSVRFSEISISESRLGDFRQVNRISNESDFASYFALTRISKKIQDSFIISNDPKAKRMRNFYQKIKWLRRIIVIFYAVMTIFQKPIWCNPREYSNNCQEHIVDNYKIPTFITFYLPIYAYYTIEIIFILMMFGFKLLKIFSFSIITQNRKIITIALFVVGSIIILNDIMVMAFDNDYRQNISTLLKPIFLVLYSQEFQSVVIDYALIIYRGKEIYFLMIFSFVFFVGLGTAIFRDQYALQDLILQDEGICNSSGLPFNQLNYCTFLIMFQLQTTVNSPDIYLPYYGSRSIAVFYFILYQFINTILMINLILSLFYSQYKNLVEERKKLLLTNNQDKINQFHKQFQNKRRKSFVQIVNKNINNLNSPSNKVTQQIMDGWIFKIIMQLISLADFCLIFQDNTDRPVQIVNLVFNTILLLESIIKIVVNGFYYSTANIYNFIISIIQLVLIVATMSIKDQIAQNIIIKICCSIMSLRIFRGCAWLLKSDNFTKILMKIVSISSYLLQLFGTLLVVLTIFTAIGQLIFGGRINYSSDHISNYQWVNYNDFLSGFCTCWFLLIVNNWNVMSYDFSLSLQSNYIYLFFIFYYIIVVLLAQSVTIALLIEYLVNQVKDFSSDTDEQLKTQEDNTSIDLNTPLKTDFKKEF